MDHQRNSRNIKSTGGNIRGNQHTCSISSKKFWRRFCSTPSASPVNDLRPETKDSTTEDFKRYLNSQAPHACCVMSLTSLSSCAFLSFSWVFGDRTLVNYHVTSRAVWPTLWGWNIHHLKIYLSSTGTALLHCQNTRAEPQTKSC